MTRLLEEAIKRVRELPEAGQDEAAAILLSLASKRAQGVRPRCGVAADVGGDPAADPPAAGAAYPGMTGFEAERRESRWEVRLDRQKAGRYGASTRSIGSFDRILR